MSKGLQVWVRVPLRAVGGNGLMLPYRTRQGNIRTVFWPYQYLHRSPLKRKKGK